MKSTDTVNNSDRETITLATRTYNHLWDKLQVVMIVKFVIPENEAYWLLLKDVPTPNQENHSLTIQIPKENKLSEINWENITEYIRQVTDRKLAAQKAFQQAERNNNANQ